MRGVDKYMVIFVVGVVALVVAALVVSAFQPEETYREGTGPEEIAHNYLLALERADYERAYALLSPDIKGYPPDMQSYVRQINRKPYQFPTEDESVSLTVLSAWEKDDWAKADVRMTSYYDGGLFGGNRYSSEFQLELERVDGTWRIAEGERFFLHCWSSGKCN